MESRKRMEYGFQGYQAPALPRATRSARGRGAGNRKKTGDGNNGDGNGMVFFELLATVAGELLQEQENHKPESEVQGNKSMENCDGTVGNALGEEGNCLEQALLELDKSHIITNEDALQKQGSIGQVNKLDPDDQGSSDENAIASGASHRKLFLGDPPLKEDPDPIVQSASRSASSISKFDPLGKLSGTEKGSDLCMDAELVDEKPLQGISYAVRGGKKGSSRTEKELYFMNACEGKVSTEQSLLSAVQGLLDSGGEQAKESMGVVENGEGKGENEIDENNIGQWKREHHACENTEDEMMLDTHSLLASSAVSGEAPLCRETKPPPLVSSGSSGEAPLCIGSKPRDSFFNVPNGRIKVSRDDDDNSSGCTVPHRMTKKSFRTPYLRGAKLRRVIGAKIRKTVSASSNKRKHSEMDIMTNTERIAKSEMPGCGVGFTWQRTVKYASSKRKRLAEGTYFPISNVHTSTASASGIDSNGVNEPPASAAKMRRAKSASVASSPTSAAGSSKHSSKRSGESHVKLSIKSFTVPELCIDMPETATVTSLKRAVMEAAMNLLGGGLHVRVLLQGKKIPDESETLLQVGISNGGKLDTVGFMLEPNPVPASPACAEDPLFVLSRAATQPSSRYPMGSQTPGPAVVADSNKGLTKGRSNKINGIAGADVAVTTAGRKQTDGSQWENNEYELITSSSHVQAGSNPGALIVHPSVGADNDSGLALVPLSHKSRGSEIGKRRIRRPFTVAEVEALVHAVEKLGTGRWRDVKLRAFDHAKHRTYVDLKDKWKTLVHTAKIAPHQRRGEPVPQELLDRVICAHNYWSDQQAKQQAELCL